MADREIVILVIKYGACMSSWYCLVAGDGKHYIVNPPHKVGLKGRLVKLVRTEKKVYGMYHWNLEELEEDRKNESSKEG